MAVNARTEEFQHIEVFDKPALFTNGRIARAVLAQATLMAASPAFSDGSGVTWEQAAIVS